MTIANILRYGAEAPLPEAIPLRAGPLSLIYENGDLRYICLGEREVIVYPPGRARSHPSYLYCPERS